MDKVCIIEFLEIQVKFLVNVLELQLFHFLIYYAGIVTVTGGITLTLKTDNSFTLTCISTGGPATTVTWTRDSTTVTEGTETVLNDPVMAQYTHTLTVMEGIAGLYTCRIANDVSAVSANLTVQGIKD